MNLESSPSHGNEPLNADDMRAALFVNMVVQQTNMALVFLGKLPDPETGQITPHLETAQLFIDQLDMLAFKTRGNLDKDEEELLQQSLTSLRMAFVEAVENPPTPRGTPAPASSRDAPTARSSPPSPTETGAPPIVELAEESRKRFTKKY